MRIGSRYVVLGTVMAFALGACGGGAGSEPSEAEMKSAMLEEMNHPPGETVSDPVTITFFKKEACDAPTPQGFRCTFDVKVASRNIGASMYNNISFAVFYKDKESGKWMMRPPF
ncbi:MAG TPA: hypothetical protein VMH89_12355 [Candidatus Acidoferrum sp.]|nr:hypothetical protein [Candidatus Acidoferrum sp.]